MIETPPPSYPSLKKVCFVIPTYNEADNIALLLRQILGLADGVDFETTVMVLDDRSPDGTGAIVAEMAKIDPRIGLLEGPKRGLGSAYARGFDAVLEDGSYDAIVQMDADFSHAPSDAFRLLRALADADVAIGSRYVHGGDVDPAWGHRRRWISRMGNACARYIAGIYRVKDCTAGFKAIRTSALHRSWPLRLRVQGYVFQVASLHALALSDACIIEIPIYFADRKAGTTKLGGRDVLEFAFQVWWLRLLSRKTFVKFAITGMTGVAVNLGSFWVLRQLGLSAFVSSPIAIEISIIWNFMLNNFWTFRDREIRARKRIRGLKFNAVSLLTLALSFATFVALRTFMPEQPEMLSQLLSVVPAALANYFANSYWTFKSDTV